MNILIFGTILLGLTLFFYGIKGLLLQNSQRKKAVKILISKEQQTIYFSKEGLYGISIKASSYFNPNDLLLRLEYSNNKEVWLEKPNFKYSFFYSNTIWKEVGTFEIENIGNYTIALLSDSKTHLEILVAMT